MTTREDRLIDAAHDALGDWSALNELAFDSSLSFLDEVDCVIPEKGSSPRAAVPSPLLLPESGGADIATTDLLNEMLALPADDSENRPPTALVSSTQEEASTPPLPQPAQPKSKSSRSLFRQKQEIQYLRVQMAELEKELALLKQKANTNGESKASATALAWEKIAKRQSDEKQRVEIENVKLRELLEGQLRVARSLEKLLRKRVLATVDPLFVERKRPRGSLVPLDLEDDAQGIHARIVNQFEEVDAVMDECGLVHVTTDRDDARATTDRANAICLESTMVKIFPFALADVAEALWQCLSANHIALPDGDFTASHQSESRTDLKFAVNLRVRRTDTVVHVRGVAARRSTASRVMIVLETVVATAGPLFAGQGITCRERGYVAIEKVPASSGAPSTIVRYCVRMWPEAEVRDVAAEGAQAIPETGLFVDLVVSSYNKSVEALLQAIENMLLSRPAQGTR